MHKILTFYHDEVRQILVNISWSKLKLQDLPRARNALDYPRAVSLLLTLPSCGNTEIGVCIGRSFEDEEMQDVHDE